MEGKDEICLLKEVSKKLTEFETSQRSGDNEFNVFSELEIEDREVIMCRMLRALLDPRGAHGQGSAYLKLFCRTVLYALDARDPFTDQELDDVHTEVIKEFLIPESGRRIDLVIETPCRFIPIEAKIRAEEQENQVFDYCQFTEDLTAKWSGKKKKWSLFYLTLNGNEPSSFSTEGQYKDRIECISWKDDIDRFLSEALKITPSDKLKFVIRQYQTAIESLTGKMSEEERAIMKNILTTPEYMKAADNIAGSIRDAKVSFLKKLFSELEKELTSRTKDLPDVKVTYFGDLGQEILDFSSIKKSVYPGINMLLDKIGMSPDGKDCYLAIRFELEWRSYVAVVIAEKQDNRYVSSITKETASGLFDKAFQLMHINRNPSCTGWLVDWHYVPGTGTDERHNDAPNFKIPGDDRYYALYDDSNRREFVVSVADAMMDYYHKLHRD